MLLPENHDENRRQFELLLTGACASAYDTDDDDNSTNANLSVVSYHRVPPPHGMDTLRCGHAVPRVRLQQPGTVCHNCPVCEEYLARSELAIASQRTEELRARVKETAKKSETIANAEPSGMILGEVGGKTSSGLGAVINNWNRIHSDGPFLALPQLSDPGISIMTKMGWSYGQGLGASSQGRLEPVPATKRSVGRMGVGYESFHDSDSDGSEGGVSLSDESALEMNVFNEADDLIDLDSDEESDMSSISNGEHDVLDTIPRTDNRTDNGADILEIDVITERFIKMGRADYDTIMGMDEATRRVAFEMEMEETAIAEAQAYEDDSQQALSTQYPEEGEELSEERKKDYADLEQIHQQIMEAERLGVPYEELYGGEVTEW